MKGKTKKPEHTSWGDRRQVARKRASTALRQRIVHRWWMFCQHRRIMHVGPYLCTAGMPKFFHCRTVRSYQRAKSYGFNQPLRISFVVQVSHRWNYKPPVLEHTVSIVLPVAQSSSFLGASRRPSITNVRPADRDDVPDERDDRDVSDLAVHGRSRSTGERTPPAMDYTLAECSARKPKPPIVLLIVRFSSIAPSVRHCTA